MESRNIGKMEWWKNGKTRIQRTGDRMEARYWILDTG
jgi:hypothetical protein